MDHVPPAAEADGDSGKSDLEKNVTARSTWVRLVFMVVTGLLYGLSRLVVAALVTIQFFYVLLSGETNEHLKTFGHSLAIYSYQVIDYLSFNTETKPFPLEASWPDALPAEREDAAD